MRDLAFDAVLTLWRRRQADGLTQKELAERLGRDPGWVSKALRGPANWEFKTFARLVRALEGEVDIEVHALEDPLPERPNYDVYADYNKPKFMPLRPDDATITRSMFNTSNVTPIRVKKVG